MTVIRAAKPTDMPPHPPPPFAGKLTTVEQCTCGSGYQSAWRRDPILWAAWTTAHLPHGFRMEEGE